MRTAQKTFFNLGLPKWPCLLVSGKRITEAQAAVILIRTDGFYFSSNAHDFDRELRKTAGLPSEDYNRSIEAAQAAWQKEDEVKKSYGVIDLEYLNNAQIVSSYVGGPHGWCDWNGNIFCNSFNIGKWPSVEDIFKEWQTIAKAFPFLDLRSQLLSGEQCEDNTGPLVEFIVKDGKVKMAIPKQMLVPPIWGIANITNLLTPARFREAGCEIYVFEEALKLTKASLEIEVTVND